MHLRWTRLLPRLHRHARSDLTNASNRFLCPFMLGRRGCLFSLAFVFCVDLVKLMVALFHIAPLARIGLQILGGVGTVDTASAYERR